MFLATGLRPATAAPAGRGAVDDGREVALDEVDDLTAAPRARRRDDRHRAPARARAPPFPGLAARRPWSDRSRPNPRCCPRAPRSSCRGWRSNAGAPRGPSTPTGATSWPTRASSVARAGLRSRPSPDDVLAYLDLLRAEHSPAVRRPGPLGAPGPAPVLGRRGDGGGRPDRRRRAGALGRRLPKALTEAEVERLMGTSWSRDRSGSATGPCSSCSTGPGRGSPRWSGSTSPTWPGPTACSASTERAARSGWCPLGRCACQALAEWLGAAAARRSPRHAGGAGATPRPSS